MEWFCTEKALSALTERGKRLSAGFRILLAVSVLGFVALCLLVRTENAKVMHPVLMGFAVLAGWACIALFQLGIRANRVQRGHLAMLLDGEKEFPEGRVTLTRESVQIPRSIRIRKVLLDTGAEEPRRLNLDEIWVSRMPPDGSRMRLAVTHGYIAGVEMLEPAPGRRTESGVPARARRAAGLIPLLGIWLIAAVILGSFVFYRITDTDPARKITLWVDGDLRQEEQLAALLEKSLPDSVRMVQVHAFRYAMFGSEALKAADLYIVPDGEKDQFAGWFAPGEEGIPVSGPEAAVPVASAWILYRPEETYRLYLGAGSPHLEDGLAAQAAGVLLSLTE